MQNNLSSYYQLATGWRLVWKLESSGQCCEYSPAYQYGVVMVEKCHWVQYVVGMEVENAAMKLEDGILPVSSVLEE